MILEIKSEGLMQIIVCRPEKTRRTFLENSYSILSPPDNLQVCIHFSGFISGYLVIKFILDCSLFMKLDLFDSY